MKDNKLITDIWNELSEKNKNFVISNYNAYIDECNSNVVSIYEDIFGKENLNSKNQIKTWEDVVKTGYNIKKDFVILKDGSGDDCIWYDGYKTCDKVVKKAIAVFKISKLIELGYGGIITDDEWKNSIEKYTINIHYCEGEPILEKGTTCYYSQLLAFHTKEQRDKFLKYNEELIKHYYMV